MAIGSGAHHSTSGCHCCSSGGPELKLRLWTQTLPRLEKKHLWRFCQSKIDLMLTRYYLYFTCIFTRILAVFLPVFYLCFYPILPVFLPEFYLCFYLYFTCIMTCFQAPRRMTEPNEEDLEPLVIEPRPEILQATTGGQTREENKPTTICLICGHVLFKKVNSRKDQIKMWSLSLSVNGAVSRIVSSATCSGSRTNQCHDYLRSISGDPSIEPPCAARVSRVLQRPPGHQV